MLIKRGGWFWRQGRRGWVGWLQRTATTLGSQAITPIWQRNKVCWVWWWLWRRNVNLVQLESCWIIAVKMYNKWTKVAAYFSLNDPPQKDQKDFWAGHDPKFSLTAFLAKECASKWFDCPSWKGLVGLACTNGTPWVAATRSRGQRVRFERIRPQIILERHLMICTCLKKVLSTNPIAFSAPGKTSGMCLDMATSAVAAGWYWWWWWWWWCFRQNWSGGCTWRENPNRLGSEWRRQKHQWSKVKHYFFKKSAKTTHWGPITRVALKEGAGLPLGGAEETGGYKGFGLALMVEVRPAILRGHCWPQHVCHPPLPHPHPWPFPLMDIVQ